MEFELQARDVAKQRGAAGQDQKKLSQAASIMINSMIAG